MPQLVSATSVSTHLFKTPRALSWSQNDLSLSSVNGSEGLDGRQHLLLAQLMVEARSCRASPLWAGSKPPLLSPLALVTALLGYHPSLCLQHPSPPSCAVPAGAPGHGGCAGRAGAPLPALRRGCHGHPLPRAAPTGPAVSRAGCAHPRSRGVWRDRQCQPAERGRTNVPLG